MANIPALPIQAGGNLSALSYVKNEDDDEPNKQKEIEELADALDLETDDVEQEIIELEDGSVIVNMEKTQKPSENPEFYANLAEEIEESTLDDLSYTYLDLIEVDRESRKKRDEQYEEGLRRTGLGNDAPGGANFQGASKVVHPIMAEACVDFGANASRQLLPPDGLVKTDIKGKTAKLVEEHIECCWCVGVRNLLATHDSVKGCTSSQNVIRFDSQHFAKCMSHTVSKKRPDFHFSKSLTSSLCLSTKWLLCNE